MKERGAMVRPSDLENANKKKQAANAMTPLNVPKSQTPGVDT